ncbi:transketolase [Candidatus Parcubacteria bacterium]|nr:MAG: transketolase [Candidatus Parcubacteria bacterium]
MDALHEEKLKFLEEMANTLREDVIKMLAKAGSGHSAGPLGMAEVFATFYFHILAHDPDNPEWPERDRLVLSNGHICPILYAALARAGYFSVKELDTLRKINSRLQGHPHRTALPGIENTSGPLGSGLSQAAGMALAARMDGKRYRVFCITSDGEHQEGNIWEAVMFAGKYRLGNLTAVMDRNNIQIDGFTEQVMPLEPLREKYQAFNWNVVEIDGHNPRDLVDAVAEAEAVYEKPTMILAHTIPGRGVSFMERKYEWHGKPPTKEEANRALKELRARGKRLQRTHIW